MKFNTPIFSDRAIKSLGNKYYQFENEFISNWLYNTYLGEYETTLAYPKLRSNFEQNYYQNFNLTIESKKIISQYFDRMIHDETVHAQLLLNLIKSNFNINVLQHDIIKTEKQTFDRLRDNNLTQLLTKYYVGECYLWTGFYLTYKNCQDAETAKIFHRLVVDESHHNNNILKIYKKLQTSICFDNNNFLSEVKDLRYFELWYVKKFLNLPEETSKKSQWWLKLIYEHEWQQKFNLIFLKKTFKLYELFNPDSDLDNYCKIINKDVLITN